MAVIILTTENWNKTLNLIFPILWKDECENFNAGLILEHMDSSCPYPFLSISYSCPSINSLSMSVHCQPSKLMTCLVSTEFQNSSVKIQTWRLESKGSIFRAWIFNVEFMKSRPCPWFDLIKFKTKNQFLR